MELESFVVNLDCFDFEVDSDGGNIIVLEILLAESHEDVGFTDTRVTDDYEFDEVVVGLVFSFEFGHEF